MSSALSLFVPLTPLEWLQLGWLGARAAVQVAGYAIAAVTAAAV